MDAEHQSIRYLGFVINFSRANKEVTHALVNMQEDHAQWYVIALSASLYNKRLKDYVGRYFRNIFWLSIQIWEACKKENKLRKGYAFLNNKSAVDQRMAKYLREGSRKDKGKGAFEDFPEIKRAIYYTLFGTQGSEYKNNLHTIWKGPSAPSAIFFWTHLQFENSPLKKAEMLPFEKVTASNLDIKHSLDPQTLKELADSMLFTHNKVTWQDLYLRSLIIDSKMKDFIDLTVSLERDFLGISDQPLSTSDKEDTPDALTSLINNNRSILLGPSGSGKSTLLKKLASHFAKESRDPEGGTKFPIFCNLKHLGVDKNNSLSEVLCESICETIQRTPSLELEEWFNENREDKSHSRESRSRKKILESMTEEVRIWLEDGMHLSNAILLIDGYSDLLPDYEQKLFYDMRKLQENCHNIIIAAKQMTTLLSELKFPACFTINPLTNGCIIQFMKGKRVDGTGKIVMELSKHNPKLLQLVQRPFYLKVFCGSLSSNNLEKQPSSPAKFIESCILSSIRRKEEANETAKTRIDPLKFNNCLAFIAHEIISNVVESKRQYLNYPDDFACISYKPDIEKVLLLGQTLGILRISDELFSKTAYCRRVTFEHDLYRDFYAAVWLKQIDFSSQVNKEADALPKFKVWDNPIIMYFELNSDAGNQDALVLAISNCDPYLAAKCVEVTEGIQNETILKVIDQLKQWECDFFNPETKLLSNEGVNAARILFSRLPLELIYAMIDDNLQYSLEFFAIPQILLSDGRIKTATLAKKIASAYKHHPTILFDIIDHYNDAPSFEVIVLATDDLISQNVLSVDTTFRLIQIIIGTEYKPNYEDLLKLHQVVRNPAVKNALYFKARHLPQLKEIAKNTNDDMVKLIYVFNMAEQTSNDFSKFAEIVQNILQGCYEDQVFFLMLSYVATRYPKYIEPVLILQLERELGSECNPARVGHIVIFLVMCDSESAVNAVAKTLATGDAHLITEMLFLGQARLIAREFSKKFTKKLINMLAAKPYKQIDRSAFLRFVLGERKSEQEYEQLVRQLNVRYKYLKKQEQRTYDKEFELRAACLLSWRSINFTAPGTDWDDKIIEEIAPVLARYRLVNKEHSRLRNLFQQDNEQDIERAIDFFFESSFMNCHIEEQVIALKAAIPDNKIKSIMTVMWNRIDREMRNIPDQKTRMMLYWYRRLKQIIAGQIKGVGS
jgi:energy-coupling factor transporter ATP-binding protein EcfA2